MAVIDTIDFEDAFANGIECFKFAELIESLGFSQASFADFTGHSVSSVNRYCRPKRKDGRRAPRYVVALALSYGLLSRANQDRIWDAACGK